MRQDKKYCEYYNKICYTKEEAQHVINSVKKPINYYSKGVKKRRPKIHKNKIPIRIYYCKFCNYWHTTSWRSLYYV